MSLTELFSSRTVCVSLAPDLLTAVVRSGKRIVAHSEVRIPLDQTDGKWDGALAAFGTYLRTAGVTLKGVPVSVALTTRWCQLAMIPWSDALLHQGSAQRFQQAQFIGIYGDAARTWAIVCDDAPYGQPRLACAIERDFLQGLQDVARDCGHPCMAIESVLSITWRAIASSQPQAFALVEPGRLVLAAAANGRIHAVQAQALRGPWENELPQAWQRWTLRAPELGEIAQVALVSLDERPAAQALPEHFDMVKLPPAPAPGYAAVAMMRC
ncbi:hypothetical protein F2P45_12000 [Massilia sp. CCM 8733]|uniref:DUF429 domain-containing protein n=1 Tax=Massilia mucilaginosa TaxID=2609282 RepID=A0ABX0NSJ1_9BURK|nr:hypothetical protein [Massilia mucilaginosa]NHZ89728.1 hypothetical protein [Massilia mucilaginosa]